MSFQGKWIDIQVVLILWLVVQINAWGLLWVLVGDNHSGKDLESCIYCRPVKELRGYDEGHRPEDKCQAVGAHLLSFPP
jgi:hypothetical protein